MTTDAAPTPPRRMPALLLLLLLPALLRELLAGTQAWLDQARRADRALVDVLADQQRLALTARRMSMPLIWVSAPGWGGSFSRNRARSSWWMASPAIGPQLYSEKFNQRRLGIWGNMAAGPHQRS